MNKKLLFSFALGITLVIIPMFANIAGATNTDDRFGMNVANQLSLPSTTGDPKEVAVDVVRYIMTFLGIIATIIILLGGFKWMTAGGNEDKIAEAKKTIIAGIVGLIIIIAAYAIVQVIVSTTVNVLQQ